MSRRTAVVLAAGKGSRLGELGRRYSKPMVPILGRPLIDWVLERLRNAGIERLVVVVHPTNAALANHLAKHLEEVSIVEQTERRGMADAVARALPSLGNEPFLVCAADSLFRIGDIRGVCELGEQSPGQAVIGVLDMGVAATAERSAVTLLGSRSRSGSLFDASIDAGRVESIIEKPPPGATESGLVGMPLYWLPRPMDELLRRSPGDRPERQIAEALADFIAAEGVVRAHTVAERLEVTRPEDIARMEQALREASFSPTPNS